MSKADVIMQIAFALPLVALFLIPPRKRVRRS